MASYGYDGVGNILHLQGMSPYNDYPSNDLTSTPSGNYTYDANGNTQTDTSGKAHTWDWGLNSSGLGHCALVLIILLICVELTGCGSTTSPTENGSAPTIASFTADPTSINSGTSSTLSWMVAGATSIAITPGTFTSTSATGSTSVSPTVTTTYTLTATNAAGSTTSTLTVTVNTTSKPTISSFTASPTSINFGFQQYAELGDDRGDEYCHHAGDLHVHIRKWFDEREPNGDDHLHSDRYQCHGLDHVYADRYRKHAKQTNHQLLHRESHKYHFGFQQYAELGDDRGDEYCHHAGDIHVHIREWFDEREPDGDDHLHADGYQYRGLDYIHGKSHGNSVRRSLGDHDHFLPRRNTRRSVCRLHHRRQRRLSTLHLFRSREFQRSSLAGGNVSRCNYGSHQQLTDRRSRHLHARICSYGLNQCAGDSEHQHRHQRQ